MADQSYLFGGTTPSSLTNSVSDTSTTLPAWLQEYTRGLAGQATEVAGGDYQPYQAPTGAATYGQDTQRIAGFDPMQTQANQNVVSNQGNYQPFLNYASQTVPQAVGSYMNPYTDSVVDRIAQLGQRNLSENLLPQVNSTFTGAGQFGSSRNADFTNRALRDANESIMGQQASALQTGFQNASTNALNDLSRYSALGQTTQQLGAQDASLLSTIGQQNQALTQQNLDVANQDWQNQNNFQKGQLDSARSSEGFRRNPAPTLPIRRPQRRRTSSALWQRRRKGSSARRPWQLRRNTLTASSKLPEAKSWPTSKRQTP